MNDYAITEMLERISAEIYGREPRPEVPSEPDARIETRGTITFGEAEVDEKREVPDLLPSVAEEIPRKPLPWGWIIATGSLVISLIAYLSMKREPR